MLRRLCNASLVLLSFLLVGCDHATKRAASALLADAPPVTVVPGVFELRYTENHDMAFSLLRGWSHPDKPALLAILACAMVLLMAFLWWRRRAAPLMEQAGYALILAGAVGNIADRIGRGYVVDFFHLRHWPVFNVADIALVVGVALIALRARAARGGDRPAAAGP